MKRRFLPYYLLGVFLALSMALTTDQILNAVYNSSSQALTVKVVGGSGPGTGTVTSTGMAGHLATLDSATNITNYAGSACAAGTVAASIGVDGTVTCVTAGSTNITNVSGSVFIIPNKSSTGTTLNKLVKLDTTASPATAVIATTSDTVNILGVCVSGCGTTGNATVLSVGQGPCVFSNAATVGHYVIVSTSVNGDCADSGSATTFPTGVAVVGVVAETGAAGSRQVDFNTPDVASASAGPNGKGITLQVNGTTSAVVANLNAATPAAGAGNTNVTWQTSTTGNTTSVSGYLANPTAVPTATLVPTATPQPTATPPVNISYAGTLNVTGTTITNPTATPVPNKRIWDCSSGSSADAAPVLPAATGTGLIIDIFKVDSGSKNCVITRAGSDAINGGTTRTLSAQWKHDTCRDYASAQWICVGDGT